MYNIGVYKHPATYRNLYRAVSAGIIFMELPHAGPSTRLDERLTQLNKLNSYNVIRWKDYFVLLRISSYRYNDNLILMKNIVIRKLFKSIR